MSHCVRKGSKGESHVKSAVSTLIAFWPSARTLEAHEWVWPLTHAEITSCRLRTPVDGIGVKLLSLQVGTESLHRNTGLRGGRSMGMLCVVMATRRRGNHVACTHHP